MRVFYLVLLSAAGLLIVLLIFGTIFALVRSPNSSALFKFGKTRIEQPAAAQLPGGDIRIFSGLGRLRIPLSNSSIMIISIAFPYQANDIPFTEELAVKISEFKNIASDYFSSLEEEKIIYFDEEAAKKEILKLYNNVLRLGRIEALYFNEMMIIDGN